MPKLATLLLLLLPVLASAECGIARDGNAMTIVVGKDPKCLSSESFRESFKSGVAVALAESDAIVAQAQKRAYDDRTPRHAKLWAIAERQYQVRAGGRYFGQGR